MNNIELFNDHFQNFKSYGIPRAQLIIADVPYNLGANAYASNPAWYLLSCVVQGIHQSMRQRHSSAGGLADIRNDK